MSGSPFKHPLKRTGTTAGYSGGGGSRGRGTGVRRGRGRGRGYGRGSAAGSTAASQVLFQQGFLRGTGQQLSRFSAGPETKQLSEGTSDTKALEDVPNSYHALSPPHLSSGTYTTGTPSQWVGLPTKVYLAMTSAGQDRSAAGVQTPENFCIAGKAYQCRKLTLRFLIDFSEMSTLPPGAFRFRVVSGYITNNAFDSSAYSYFEQHSGSIISQYFSPDKKFGGLGVTGELKVISDRIHQVAPLSAQAATSTDPTGVVTYANINGFVDFSKHVRGTKRLRLSTANGGAGDGNLLIDNRKSNTAARIPFLLVQNLDGMEGKESGNKSPKISYFWAKQFVDY